MGDVIKMPKRKATKRDREAMQVIERACEEIAEALDGVHGLVGIPNHEAEQILDWLDMLWVKCGTFLMLERDRELDREAMRRTSSSGPG
jgi:hypothetical protein